MSASPMRALRTTVVIPTYNERGNLSSLVPRIANLGIAELRILVVDDASPDGTGEVAEALGREGFPVSTLHRDRKEGLGAAYVAGFTRALADGADVVVQMDADGSHDPAAIPTFLRAIEHGADLAVGSRCVPGGRIVGWGLHRHLMSGSAQRFSRWALGFRTRDVTSGFRAWRASALADMLGLPHAYGS